MPFSYIGWHVLIIECQMSKNNFRPLLCHHLTLDEIIFERAFIHKPVPHGMIFNLSYFKFFYFIRLKKVESGGNSVIQPN